MRERHLRPAELRLVRWTELHAIAMLVACALMFAGASTGWLIVLGGASFGALLWICSDDWTPCGRFGAANAVTTARLAGVLALPAIAAIGPLAVAGCALALFALDGVDGWLARRFGLASEFGEYFDKETDAFCMLVLCVLLYGSGRFGAWIVAPGALRYGFVVFLMLARPPVHKERRNALARWIYCGMISALIVAFTPFPALYRPYAVLMALALVCSFGYGVVDLYRRPREA